MSGTASTHSSPLRAWSGWLPIAIPLFIFGLALRAVAMHGFVSQADEGIEAHLFQLLMPVQLAVIAYFAFSWLPRAPRAAMTVLVLQIALTIALFAAVFWADHLPPAG